MKRQSRENLGRLNAQQDKVKLEQLMARRKDGSKEAISDTLTDGEKVQLSVMLEKVNVLQSQLNQVTGAFTELIASIVTLRGLDVREYGVNLAAGRILPIDKPKPIEKPEDAEIKE